MRDNTTASTRLRCWAPSPISSGPTGCSQARSLSSRLRHMRQPGWRRRPTVHVPSAVCSPRPRSWDRHRSGSGTTSSTVLGGRQTHAGAHSYHRPQRRRSTTATTIATTLRRSCLVGDPHRPTLGVAGLQAFPPGRVSTFGDNASESQWVQRPRRATRCETAAYNAPAAPRWRPIGRVARDANEVVARTGEHRGGSHDPAS